MRSKLATRAKQLLRRRCKFSVLELLIISFICAAVFKSQRQMICDENKIRLPLSARNIDHLNLTAGDYGDCQAIGPRRPYWDNRKTMISSLQEFSRVYEHRPIRENKGGMRFHHSFGLWFTLKAIYPRPSFVVESGANRGHTTWMIRQALPGVRIITISPNTPPNKVDNTFYYTGNHFVDFNAINWSLIASHNEIRNAVVLFDDHQSAHRRVFEEGTKYGFRRFIFDDNCEFQQCDALSMKWLCEVNRKEKWFGFVKDNFGKVKIPQTWDEHIQQTKELNSIKFYYEFPPVFGLNRKIVPLLSSYSTLLDYVGDIGKNEWEFRSYAYLCYIEFSLL